MDSETKQLATYIQSDDPIYLAVKEEASKKAVPISRVVTWALQKWYEARLAEQRARQIEPGTITP